MRIVRDDLPLAVALTLPNAAIFAVTGVGCASLVAGSRRRKHLFSELDRTLRDGAAGCGG